MLSGFIFDVEGTLIDSVPQNLRSLQDALERFGHRVPYQTLHLYSGLDGDQTLQLIVPDAAESERKEILKVQGAIYEQSYLDSVRPFDGVRDVFRALTDSGGRIALATDCKGLAFKRYLALLDVNELIAGTACGDDVEHGKPDPRLVGYALGKIKISASQAVMIGDTPYDAEAGLEAGTKAAGLLTGGFTEESLLQAGCFAVSDSLQQLLPRLQSGEPATQFQTNMDGLIEFPSKRRAPAKSTLSG
jgi:phosphoglycolate phosphatase-like HAD superfamily hydrolase